MEGRSPKDDTELRAWLQNMIWYHHFGDEEISAATGLTLEEVSRARSQLNITVNNRPARDPKEPVLVLPYPGGRHPRIGFLDGAVDPQRETKASVFTPWDPTSYAVVDVPEAIWSNLGLLYLAHTHVPTVWTKQGVRLEPLEWSRREDGGLEIERRLPNGVVFGARVRPAAAAVRMELWLTNGTSEPLSGLRVQNCVMLRGASGFELQTNENKLLSSPYAACRNAAGNRWIITSWDPLDRVWANPPCPCFHSDPKLPDCEPGKTVRARGGLWFYEGKEIEAEIRRIEGTKWRG